jgi:DNA-directed RNA polymerase sigma subunit (sigma70/sigma32)
MREELITELKKSKEGKEVLKNIKNEDIRCRLVAFVTSVKKNHPGLLESLFTAPQLPENGSLAALGRVHKLSRERIRQIRLNMVMICEDLGKTPEAVTEVTLNKLNSFLSA